LRGFRGIGFGDAIFGFESAAQTVTGGWFVVYD
jgi:hypothetical protein